MQCFVASDETVAAGQVRNLLIELGMSCPTSHVNTLDRVWGDLDKRPIAPLATPSTLALTGQERKSEAEIEIVVVLLSTNPETELSAIRTNRRRTAARILVVGPTTDGKLVLRALRDGANEFLDKADLKAELSAAIQRISVEASPGKVVTIISASGGCGCSTLTVNLASALAATHQKCAVVDLELEFGDLATLLDLKPSYSIGDLCQNLRRLDPSLLESCLLSHSSGVELLAASGKIADRMAVTEECIHEVTTLITRKFPFALVDLGNSFRTQRTRILLQSDLVLMVLRLDFPCLRNTRAALEYLTEIGVPRDRVEVIANRSGQPNEITPAAAVEALGVKISNYIPDDPRTVNWANNNGVPVVVKSPSAKISRAIATLAAHIEKLAVSA